MCFFYCIIHLILLLQVTKWRILALPSLAMWQCQWKWITYCVYACGVSCKLHTSRTSKNLGRKFLSCDWYDGSTKFCRYFAWCELGDDVDDKDILIAIVGSQLAYIMELQDRNVELNDELNEASKMLEMVNELLAVVSNRVEDNVWLNARKSSYLCCSWRVSWLQESFVYFKVFIMVLCFVIQIRVDVVIMFVYECCYLLFLSLTCCIYISLLLSKLNYTL